MTAKLKIDLEHGILEVEGSEVFVKAIYSDFKVHFIGDEAGEELMSPTRRRRKRSRTSTARGQSQSGSGASPKLGGGQPPASTVEPETTPKPDYQLIKNLELSASQNRVSLVEFMDTKVPITNEERNLVFLYYLQHVLKTKAIKVNHIYTCYKAAKIRVPFNLQGSLENTAKRRWMKITKTGRLSVTPSGKLYVENQLPKKSKG